VTDVSQFIYRLDRPLGYQMFEAPTFHDSRHMRVVRLLALRTGHFYTQRIPLINISIGGCVEPRVIMRPEGLSKRNILMTRIYIYVCVCVCVCVCVAVEQSYANY